MTAKEKAKELFQKFYNVYGYYGIPVDSVKNSKTMALIAVEEIIEAIDWHKFETPNEQFEYWQEVKQEIEKL